MLVVLTKGANENPFVYGSHSGGDDVTCKISPLQFLNLWGLVVNSG